MLDIGGTLVLILQLAALPIQSGRAPEYSTRGGPVRPVQSLRSPLLAAAPRAHTRPKAEVEDEDDRNEEKISNGETACVPGVQISCACPNGGRGSQVCADSGARFRPCACGITPEAAPTSIQPDPPSEENLELRRANRGLLAAGVTFMCLGVAASLGAVAVHVASQGSHDSEPIVAILGVNGGVMVLFVGIPMTAVGASRLSDLKHPPQPAQARLSVGPSGFGLSGSF